MLHINFSVITLNSLGSIMKKLFVKRLILFLCVCSGFFMSGNAFAACPGEVICWFRPSPGAGLITVNVEEEELGFPICNFYLAGFIPGCYLNSRGAAQQGYLFSIACNNKIRSRFGPNAILHHVQARCTSNLPLNDARDYGYWGTP